MEICKAVKSIAGDKASCPNGLTMNFFQDCRELVKDEFFHERGSVGKNGA